MQTQTANGTAMTTSDVLLIFPPSATTPTANYAERLHVCKCAANGATATLRAAAAAIDASCVQCSTRCTTDTQVVLQQGPVPASATQRVSHVGHGVHTRAQTLCTCEVQANE